MQIDKEIKEKIGDKYAGLSDEELVKLIVAKPHNEEAALFLIYVKYNPLFKKMCMDYIKDLSWLDYCLSDIFISLKSSKGDWHILADFGWTSTLGAYLKGMAENNFLRIEHQIDGHDDSLDDFEKDGKSIQVVGTNEVDLERRMELVLLLEAVQTLPSDQKFVILKRLEDKSGKEIAEMLREKWESEGVRRYNQNGELVVPTEAYVNNLKSHALIALREKLGENRQHN